MHRTPATAFAPPPAIAIAAAVALATIATGCVPAGGPDPAPVGPATTRPQAPVLRSTGPALTDVPPVPPLRPAAVPWAAEPAGAAGQPRPDDPYTRRLANALLVPLLDDAEPPHWRDPMLWVDCEPGTRVSVGDRSVVDGEPVPSTAFDLHWKAVGCRPFGEQGPLLDAELTMRVHPAVSGRWRATVEARRIHWQSPEGRHIEHAGRFDVHTPLLLPVSAGRSVASTARTTVAVASTHRPEPADAADQPRPEPGRP